MSRYHELKIELSHNEVIELRGFTARQRFLIESERQLQNGLGYPRVSSREREDQPAIEVLEKILASL